MERSLAEKLVQAALALDAKFGDLDAAVRQIPDETERQALLRALGGLVADVYIGLIRPIARQYPDLDPEGPQAKP